MILNDKALIQWADGGLNPFIPANVNPASIDLCWSGRYRIAGTDGWSSVKYAKDSLALLPDALYLMDTLEYLKMPLDYCGKLFLKSSVARNGLEHLHACFVDPGFNGTLTLEIKNTAPWIINLKKEERVVQLVLEQMNDAPLNSYSDVGHYQNQNEPTVDYKDKRKRVIDDFFKQFGR